MAIPSINGSPWEMPIRRDLLSQTRGIILPLARAIKTVGPLRVSAGLLTEVTETILNSRTPSTRKLYALIFHFMVQRTPAGPSLLPSGFSSEFLFQDHFSAGHPPFTLKV